METKVTKWVLDPTHSELLFKVKHLMITNVKGEFKEFSATIEGESLLDPKVKAVVSTESIFTNTTDRDNHLKSADFFDVENYKEMTFESTGVKKTEEDEFKLTGILTIKDVSKEITLDVEFGGTNKDPWGNEKAGFSFKAKINRKEWGLNWNAALETGGVLVSDEVRIEGEVQFVKEV